MNKKTYLSPHVGVHEMAYTALLTDSLTKGDGDNPGEAEAKINFHSTDFDDDFADDSKGEWSDIW